MRYARILVQTMLVGFLGLANTAARAEYWSLFNIEGESAFSAQYVTYNTLGDMLSDTNRLGVFTPDHFGAGQNIVDGGSNGQTYWNLFNIEGESDLSAQFATYTSRTDMLADTNRLGVFTPNHFGAGQNLVGSASDGTTYWNLFNIEGESDFSAQFVTYSSLSDMLADTNRLGVFTPNHFGAGQNLVGSGSDGTEYWNLFNIEGESDFSAQYVTYSSLSDMLADTNRLGVFTPNDFGAGQNLVGTGSDSFPAPLPAVPEPGSWAMLVIGSALVGSALRFRKPVLQVT
jgi:hypothetical protein